MDSIRVLGIPFDFGQEQIGVRLAYKHLKNHGLQSTLSKITRVDEMKSLRLPFKVTEKVSSSIKNKRSCSQLNRIISEHIELMDLSSSFLLNIGGDHGLALGTVHGILTHHPDTVIVWADAHGDINTPSSSPTGNFHGMPLAFLLNEAKDESFNWMTEKLLPKNLIYFGPRDLDEGEKEIIQRLGILYYSSDEINARGTKDIIDSALDLVDPLGVKPIHLSFDVDIFDASDMKSTGTRVSMGPIRDEILRLGNILAKTGRMRSMDIVEFNPLLGNATEVDKSCEIIFQFIKRTLSHVFEGEGYFHESVYA